MWYAYIDPETNRVGPADSWIAIPAAKVKELIELNRKNERPPDLLEAGYNMEEDEPDYSDVVGQDSLTRMDKKKKKKKKRKPGHKNSSAPK